MPPDYLNPDGHIQKRGDSLPHWQQEDAMDFLTFRLGDALPVQKIKLWREQLRDWLLTYPKHGFPKSSGSISRDSHGGVKNGWMRETVLACLETPPQKML